MIYRTHDQPDPEKLIQLQKFITKFGYKINTTTPKTISQSLNQLAHDLQNKPESNLIQTLAIRTMAKAIYTTKNTGHYGLGFEYYTHFTSPIRRYPDLLVHRLLQNFLTQPTTHTTLNKGGQGGVSNPQGNTTSPNNAEQGGVTNLETQCKHTSAQERKAAQAERASVKYKQLQMLQPHIGDTFTAIVSGIKDYGFYVELQTNFAEGLIRLRDLTNDYYTYNEEQMTLTAQKSKHTIQLGDTIQVQITNINLQTRQMDLKPIKNFQTYQINK
jgi:VacB/RNase II family 3'-5' exoribonuclease